MRDKCSCRVQEVCSCCQQEDCFCCILVQQNTPPVMYLYSNIRKHYWLQRLDDFGVVVSDLCVSASLHVTRTTSHDPAAKNAVHGANACH